MRRWTLALIAVVLACLPILFHRASSPDLLRDTDTHVLLTTIRQREAPFSWFAGDWPLHNHFYRPVSTLSFELDNRLYGDNAAGYGLTNALLCVVCVLLLFWFLRELTDMPSFAGCGAVLFAAQHLGYDAWVFQAAYWLALLTIFGGLWRHGLKFWRWAPAVLVMLLAGAECSFTGGFGGGTIYWLPGRTATVMTVFALVAMAAYARYERLGAERTVVAPSPLDPPATKSAKIGSERTGNPVLWAVLSVLALLLALGSYEQAVMLPAVLLAVACTMRLKRFKVRWGWQAAFWVGLFAYLALRKDLIPAGVSQYQAQQFRHGPGVYISLFSYGMPFFNEVSGFLVDMEGGWLVLMTASPYYFFLHVASDLTTLYQARRQWVLALAGYSMSLLAFLPMAWVKSFAHYNYWPIALRSTLSITLLWVGFQLVLSAWSPQTRQAPKRLDPAPGSLPHP